jgi:hypothetical protein
MLAFCSSHKYDALSASGTLNPHPERVLAPLFRANPFFDACDIVQVKYEMLRAVTHEGVRILNSAHMFGFSRTAWYQIEAKYVVAGIPGLLPQRRGPNRLKKRAHTAVDAPRHSKNTSNFAIRHLGQATWLGIAVSASCSAVAWQHGFSSA